MMGAVTPETCGVTLQYINIYILLHLVGFLLTLNYDVRNHELKISGLLQYLSNPEAYEDKELLIPCLNYSACNTKAVSICMLRQS